MLRTLSSFSEALKTIFERKKSGELFDDSTSRPAPIAHYSDDKKSSIFSNHYVLTFELGHGYFAYRCVHPDSVPNEGKACFVNISSDMDYDKLYIVTELRALRRIYHPNITNLFAHYEVKLMLMYAVFSFIRMIFGPLSAVPRCAPINYGLHARQSIQDIFKQRIY